MDGGRAALGVRHRRPANYYPARIENATNEWTISIFFPFFFLFFWVSHLERKKNKRNERRNQTKRGIQRESIDQKSNRNKNKNKSGSRRPPSNWSAVENPHSITGVDRPYLWWPSLLMTSSTCHARRIGSCIVRRAIFAEYLLFCCFLFFLVDPRSGTKKNTVKPSKIRFNEVKKTIKSESECSSTRNDRDLGWKNQ